MSDHVRRPRTTRCCQAPLVRHHLDSINDPIRTQEVPDVIKGAVGGSPGVNASTPVGGRYDI
jgi:hypothetical protein